MAAQNDGRNPYVMLGIPFASARDVATRAFARKAKGLRQRRGQQTRGPDLTELTWALNQVEENIRDPRTALHLFRVPADPGALEPDADGVLRPGPERQSRITGSSATAWAQLLDSARTEALAVVHQHISSTTALPQR